MATYFDLIARPNDPIKSKTTGKFLKLSNSSNDLKVPNDWDVKSGDILPCSDYRTTDTYFITHENTLLKKHRYICCCSNQCQDFSLNTTKTNDIINWILISNESKIKFNVKFNFEGKEICNKVPQGIITGLPIGWQCEQKGVLIYTEDKIQSESIADILHDRTARYFDLVNNPELLKGIDGLPIADSDFKDFPAKGTKIPDNWDVSFGDVLNWSKGRPTEAYFVMEDRTLLKNPDRTGSGYLTIPFIITKNTRNALLKYEYVINGIGKDYVSTVEMHPDDVFIVKNWGQVPSEMHSRNVEFIYDPLEEFLYVNIPYTSKSKEFKLGSTTMKDIETWFSGALETQASFRVKYDFSGPQFQKYHDLYRLHEEDFSLPKTWSAEPGTTHVGHDFCRGEWIFHGDHKHLHEAKKNIQDFYKDLVIGIEDIPHTTVSIV
ncbi:unnamed protein product [Rotaria sp. Silwood1]|nr:unnamed protein product [Rotaria sp. Silwood1]